MPRGVPAESEGDEIVSFVFSFFTPKVISFCSFIDSLLIRSDTLDDEGAKSLATPGLIIDEPIDPSIDAIACIPDPAIDPDELPEAALTSGFPPL